MKYSDYTIEEVLVDLHQPTKTQQEKVIHERMTVPHEKNIQKSVYPLYQDFNSWIRYIHNEVRKNQ